MSNSRMILVVISIIACLIAQATCDVQYPNIDEDTGCPVNVDHECTNCAEDRNRLGCYCDDGIVTASIFTPCPSATVDPCIGNSCQNGAACVRDGLSTYKCDCTLGFGGRFCNETLPKCSDATLPCPNGECVETNDPSLPIFCQCFDGTRRDPRQNITCPISPCYAVNTSNSICQNNGTCRIINNAPVCECRGGFAGQNCTKPLKTPLCESQPGVCGVGRCQQSLSPPYYSCNCGNYASTFAAQLSDLVRCEESGCYSSNPCLNGGTCSNKGKGAFVCQCLPTYTGAKCEKQSACFRNPCLNGGTCEAFNETAYFCGCRPYFTGQRCETTVPNPCIGKSCGTYGVCEDKNGIASCLCSDGSHLDGSPCQNPCLNKDCGPGVCVQKKNVTFEATCSCPVERQGDSCEKPRDVCREGPRCGGGYCIPNYSVTRGYSCVCEGGVVKSEPCPFSKNCPIKDCGTKGVCVETNGIITKPGARPIYYVCSCQNGYITSSDCDKLIDIDIPATTECGPNGKPYPSRNPNNPIGCWCNNGTHIPEIEDDGPAQYCV